MGEDTDNRLNAVAAWILPVAVKADRLEAEADADRAEAAELRAKMADLADEVAALKGELAEQRLSGYQVRFTRMLAGRCPALKGSGLYPPSAPEPEPVPKPEPGRYVVLLGSSSRWVLPDTFSSFDEANAAAADRLDPSIYYCIVHLPAKGQG